MFLRGLSLLPNGELSLAIEGYFKPGQNNLYSWIADMAGSYHSKCWC